MTTSWPNVTLGDITTAQYGLSVPTSDDGTVPILGMKNLQDGRIVFGELSRVILTPRDIENYQVHAGDILFNRTNSFELVGKSSLVEDLTSEPTVFASYLVRLKVDEARAYPAFVNYVLNSPSSEKRLKDMATPGVSQFNINPTSLRKHFRFLLPSLSEQKAIAVVLSTWDRGIRQRTDLIGVKLRAREGLVQRLLSGSLRFQEYAKSVHEQAPLNQVLAKVSDSVIPSATEMYREIGVRSHGKGIFHKEPVSGESLGNKRVYRVVPGCLTVNIVFAWERAVAITKEREDGMIASHRFPMFRPNPDRLLAEYALLYLLSKKGSEALELASPGGAGRNRTLSQTEFLKNLIPLPSVAEQRRVVTFIQTADREIELLRKQLAALKQQKKGLMQKLLTGEVRVPQSRKGDGYA